MVLASGPMSAASRRPLPHSVRRERARNRPRNRGLRLDYFLLSAGLAPALRDVQHLQQQLGSDHCPVVMELDLHALS